jgi:predicted DNA-binding protein (MmcQ/YjbR family)
MRHEDLVAYCLAKPGAVQDEPWEGDIVAKVGGKIFAFLGSGGLGVKCGRDADEAEELRQRFPDSVTRSAYIGQHGWNRIELDPATGPAIEDEELRELVDTSYDLIVAKLPKRLRPAAG